MPPVQLVIQVDGRDVRVLRQFRSELEATGQSLRSSIGPAAQQASQSLSTIASHSDNSIASLMRFGGAAVGITSVGAALTATVRSMMDFETRQANVNTLIAGNVPLQQKLRDELLKLPPILGSSTELSKGLYSALSAGVEPAKAVEFVGIAAKSAKAGMADLGTTVDSIATIMKAYGSAAGSATDVSDIMFQTVNVGKGTFDEFARSFATVSPVAKTLGISLKETAATLGTLSFAFPSAAEGATGFRSLMANLIQNMDKFRLLGIDVQAVIGKSGLAGLMDEMKRATGGNIEVIRELIPDIQGLQTALALTGESAAQQAKNLETMSTAAGSTAAAAKEQAKTMKAAWDEFSNTLDRFAQEVAPPVLNALSGMAKSATVSLNEMKQTVEDLSSPGLWEQIRTDIKKTGSDIATWITSTDMDVFIDGLKRAGAAIGNAASSMGGMSQASEILAKTNQKAFASTTQLTEGIESVSVTAKAFATNTQMVEGLESISTTAQKMGETGKEALKKFEDGAKKVKEELATVKTAWDVLGIASAKSLKESADRAIAAAKSIASSSEASASDVIRSWEAARSKIVAAYGHLPAEFKAIDAAIAAGNVELARILIEKFTKTTSDIKASYNTVPPAIRQANAAIVQDSVQSYTVIAQTAQERANAIGAAWEKLSAETAARNRQMVEDSLNAQRNFVQNQLGPAPKGIEFAIANTLPELEKQYASTLAAIGNIGSDLPGMTGWAATQKRVLQDLLTRIGARLDELRAKGTDAGRALNPLLPTSGGGGGDAVYRSRAGGLASGGVLGPPSGLFSATGGSSFTPGTPRAPSEPPPVRSGGGGFAPPTPTGPINTGYGLPATKGGVSNIQVNVQGDTDPERTVRKLLPALREAVRRGELTR